MTYYIIETCKGLETNETYGSCHQHFSQNRLG